MNDLSWALCYIAYVMGKMQQVYNTDFPGSTE